MRTLALALAAFALGCSASAPISKVRYANKPPTWRVNDRQDVRVAPPERPDFRRLRHMDGMLFRRVTHAMELHEPSLARNINSVGGVPDSTWFTNRIGVRELPLKELARGPNREGPDLSAPLTILSAKVGGTLIGFRVKDAKGTVFLIKFDPQGKPVVESAAEIAVQRLLWACGYHVPENFLIHLRRDQLVLGEGAYLKDALGNKIPLSENDVSERLALVDTDADGTYRTLASKFLTGRPLGGFPMEGVRSEDPNDVVPHQHRRELRGLKVFFSWLQYTDVKEANTLDMWVEDADRPGKHFLIHYLLDFGKSFGAFTRVAGHPGDGHEERVDYKYFLRGLVSFGLWKRPWEGTSDPGIRGVAMFDADHFDPATWSPQVPFAPFKFIDPRDGFWAARILMKFTRDHIRTALLQGEYDDSQAVGYLTDVLVARQRKTAAHYFSLLSPLDSFRVARAGAEHELCYRDLAAAYGLVRPAESVSYAGSAYDYEENALATQAAAGDEDHATRCVRFASVASHEGYTIVRLQVTRRGKALSPVEIHLANAPGTDELRVVGVNRH